VQGEASAGVNGEMSWRAHRTQTYTTLNLFGGDLMAQEDRDLGFVDRVHVRMRTMSNSRCPFDTLEENRMMRWELVSGSAGLRPSRGYSHNIAVNAFVCG
jgi:hypothetical protein